MTAPVTKNMRDGTVTVLDGAGTPNSCEIVCDEGDFAFTEIAQEVKEIKDRGVLSHLRLGDEVPVDWSFSVKFKEFLQQGANPVTPYEALTFQGYASGWTTTNDDGGEVETVDIQLSIATPSTGETAEEILLTKCYGIKVDFKEADEYDTLSVSGKAFVTRAAIEKAAS